jgi:hypothetical protein
MAGSSRMEAKYNTFETRCLKTIRNLLPTLKRTEHALSYHIHVTIVKLHQYQET